jgi:hypothetical protein
MAFAGTWFELALKNGNAYCSKKSFCPEQMFANPAGRLEVGSE